MSTAGAWWPARHHDDVTRIAKAAEGRANDAAVDDQARTKTSAAGDAEKASAALACAEQQLAGTSCVGVCLKLKRKVKAVPQRRMQVRVFKPGEIRVVKERSGLGEEAGYGTSYAGRRSCRL